MEVRWFPVGQAPLALVGLQMPGASELTGAAGYVEQ